MTRVDALAGRRAYLDADVFIYTLNALSGCDVFLTNDTRFRLPTPSN